MGDSRPSLIEKLKKYVQKNPMPKENDVQSVEWMTMLEIENSLFKKNSEKIPSYQSIPPFFFSKNTCNPSPVPTKSSRIQQLISKEAQKAFQKKQKDKILTSEELDAMWEYLLSNATPPIKDSEESINYEGFEKVKEQMINFLLKTKMKPTKKLTLKPLSGTGSQNSAQIMSPRQIDSIKKQVVKKISEYLNPIVFMRMSKDDLGRISIPNYFNFVLRKISLIQSRIELMSYDEDGKNSLTKEELSKFIENQIPKLPSLATIEPSFKKTYIETATEKFFFFLDMTGKGTIPIDTILGSNILIEFNELQNTSLTPEELMENWFSIPSTLSVYKTFLDLDLSKTGMLQKVDFARFNHATFTKTFIDRLYEEHPSTANEMSYRDFVRFILAYENKDSKPGLKYYWKILDVNKKGYITPFEIGMFFKAITKRIIEKKIEPIPMKNVVRELFEMVQPVADASKITFEELYASKQGPNFVLFFGDFNAFWRYENREMQQATED